MFIVNLTYLKPSEEVDKILPLHVKFLEKHYASGHFICSGRKSPRTGGIILCNAKNASELNDIICEDPFFTNGIAHYETIEFLPTKSAAAFQAFLI